LILLFLVGRPSDLSLMLST